MQTLANFVAKRNIFSTPSLYKKCCRATGFQRVALESKMSNLRDEIAFLFVLIRGRPLKTPAIREGLSVADKGGGVLQLRTSALFCVKNFGFYEIYGVTAWTRKVEPVRTFFGKGGEGGSQFFSILCGRLLWTAPYLFCT